MSPELTVPIALLISMLFFGLIVEYFFASFILSYKLTDKSVLFLLFKVIPIKKINFSDIKEVKVGSLAKHLGIAIQSETQTSRIFGPRVFICRRRKFIPWIV